MTSKRRISSPLETTKLYRKRKVIASMTGEYDSSSSISGLCEKPCATNCTLYLTILLFSLCFHTKTHLYPSGFTPLGVWTTGPKFSRFINEFKYACIDSFHFGQSFLYRHSSTFCDLGSSSFLMMFKATWKVKILLITISF